MTTYIRRDYVMFFFASLLGGVFTLFTTHILNREVKNCENQLFICNTTLEACNYEVSIANEKYMRSLEETNRLKLENQGLRFENSQYQIKIQEKILQ